MADEQEDKTPPESAAPETTPVAAEPRDNAVETQPEGAAGQVQATAHPFAALGDDLASLDQEAALARAKEERAEYQRLKKQLPQYQHYIAAGQQYQALQQSPEWTAYQQWQAEQAKAKEPEKPWYADKWTPPQTYRKYRLDDYTTVDEATGKRDFSTAATPDIRRAIQADIEFDRQWKDKFESNPIQFMYDALRDQLLADARNEQQRGFGNFRQFGEIERWENENSNWLYADTAHGKVMTREGQMFHAHVQELKNLGLSDPQQIIRYALAGVTSELGQAAQAAPKKPATPAQARAGGQNVVTSAAERRASAGGSVAGAIKPGAPAQNNQLTLRERLSKELNGTPILS